PGQAIRLRIAEFGLRIGGGDERDLRIYPFQILALNNFSIRKSEMRRCVKLAGWAKKKSSAGSAVKAVPVTGVRIPEPAKITGRGG
ncbi:MAG: hypothetical protein L6R28_25305, partial [Planctomycetes bacterium]|nr:hypothetical protein [Planctomycetota bacterium]